MFMSGKYFIFNLIILFSLLTIISGDCSIELPSDVNRKPSFYGSVGRQKIKLNTDGKNVIQLFEKQKLEAYCDSKFERPSYYKNKSKLFIKCESQYIYISSDKNHAFNNNNFQRPNLQCSFENWNLYESAATFDWCPTNLTSYIVAKPELWRTKTGIFNKLAGICYDINNLMLHSIYYTLTPNGAKNVQPSILRDSYQPELHIDYAEETFGKNSISRNMPEEDQFKNWVNVNKYESSSIMQHLKLNTLFNDQFAVMLEFLWWPNLRLYNWKRYVDALTEHVEDNNQSFDILAGISGTLKAPFYKSCQENYTMRPVWLKPNGEIPLYVWNYLQDSSNSSNEVVIIGFNSPFYELYSPNDVIFCTDICQNISWLKKVKSSFRYNVMGIVFCCNVEDVRSSKQLYGFPAKDLKSKSKIKLYFTTQKPQAVMQYENEDELSEIDTY